MGWLIQGKLQYHVGEVGAHRLLHDGPQKTGEIEAELVFETEGGRNDYAFRLAYGAGDSLFFADERFRFSERAIETEAPVADTGRGAPRDRSHAASRIGRPHSEDHPITAVLKGAAGAPVPQHLVDLADASEVEEIGRPPSQGGRRQPRPVPAAIEGGETPRIREDPCRRSARSFRSSTTSSWILRTAICSWDGARSAVTWCSTQPRRPMEP